MATQAKNITVKIAGSTVTNEVYSVNVPSEKVEFIETTNLASTHKEFLTSDLKDYGQLKMEVNWTGTDLTSVGTSGTMQIDFGCFSPSASVSFNGIVEELGEVKAERNGILKREITIKKIS